MKNILSVRVLAVLLAAMLLCSARSAHASSSLAVYPYTISSGDPEATAATITFNTSIAGGATISYGTTASYGSSVSSSASVTSHSIALSGLAPDTTYHFMITATDTAGDSATSSDQTFTTAPSCAYYVDSANGNDANSGTSVASPLQHLMAVPALSANGQSICLRRGSVFKDFLVVGRNGTTSGPNGNGKVNNVTVEDYGPANLAMPLIDNSDAIPASAWSLVPGTVSLYQATVTGPGTSTTTPYGAWTNTSASTYVNVFECKSSPCIPTGEGGNDNFLETVNSQATASTTAGSYYIAGENSNGSSGPTSLGSFTIFMNPTDGSSPITNGYTYSFSNRETGISIYGYNSLVKNIAVKKSSGNGGGFIIDSLDGSDATYENIEADQGGKHNMLCSGGCTVKDSKFVDAYYPSTASYFVAFDSLGTGLPIVLDNDTFLDGVLTPNNLAAAMIDHTGDLVPFSDFIVDGGLVEGVNNLTTGWSGLGSADLTKATINGLTCINASGCVGTQGTTTIANVQDVSPNNSGATLLKVGGPGPLTIASSTMCDKVSFNQYGIQTTTGNQLTVASSTFYVQSASGFETAIYFGGVGSLLNMFNTMIAGGPSGGNLWIKDSSATSTAPYTGDYNSIFLPNITQATINGTNYTSLASWQAASGQDAHSTTTSPTPSPQTIACTPHQLTFTGPSSGAVEASSASFTVTPSVGYNSVGAPIGYVGTVTIAPSGTAAAGLSPVTLVFPYAASTTAQSFAIKPTATGTLSLVESADGATTSPAFLASTTLTYTVSAAAPSAPYGTPVATAGNGQATVAWYAPYSIGGSPVTSYAVASDPAGFATTTSGTSITATGLSNGTSYTFTVTATNAIGTSASSTPSNAVTPAVPPAAPVTAASSVSSSGGSVSTAELASLLAPGPATDAYLASRGAAPSAAAIVPGCPAGYVCTPAAVGSAPAPAVPGASASASFPKSLRLGDVSSEVKALQAYLNAHGYAVASAGPGSPGHETDIFGALTKAAVEKLQKALGLPAYGFFGPMTRAAIAAGK
ncbi:MAG: peptidoglycan-binding protein [Patescibacteria group bacterium]|nr:peptidoglycan-binding protein [Patescibacteria group bacterium]